MGSSRWLLLVALLLSAGSAPAAAALDPARLASIERELTIPICGVGYLDSRAGQLSALGSFDKLPYLEQLARQRTTHLSELAVQLIAREKKIASRRALERIEADAKAPEATRFEAARQLATVFRSRAGKPRLEAALAAPDVQRRADGLSALFALATHKELGTLVELAADEHQYAVDRFMSELATRPAFKKPMLRLIRQRHASAQGARRARFAFARVLLGEPAHAAEVKKFLLGYTGPISDEALYNLAWICHELAARGHAFAFDAVLHLASLYPRAPSRAFNWYLLSVFFEKAPFDRKLVDGRTEDDAARMIGAWWSANASRMVFDGKRFRLR
jgi:hypothetical protein